MNSSGRYILRGGKRLPANAPEAPVTEAPVTEDPTEQPNHEEQDDGLKTNDVQKEAPAGKTGNRVRN